MQKSEVSIGSGHAFDPTLSQKKVELVQGCFGDFLLLAHFHFGATLGIKIGALSVELRSAKMS